MKEIRLLFTALAAFLAIHTWADNTLNCTFTGDTKSYVTGGVWGRTFYNLDKAQIAKDLGLSETELTSKFSAEEKNGTVVCYTLDASGNRLIVPLTSNGAAGGPDPSDGKDYCGYWLTKDGVSQKGNSGARYYYLFNFNDYRVAVGFKGDANISYGQVLTFPLYFQYTDDNGEKTTETVNVTYRTYGSDAGTYTFNDSPLHADYGVSYIDIDNGKIATALGLASADDVASKYKADNSGDIKLAAYTSSNSLITITNAGGNNNDKGYWLGSDGYELNWGKGKSYVFFTYDVNGKLGVGQMSTIDQGSAQLGNGMRFYVVFTYGGRQAVVTVNYKVNTLDETRDFTPVAGSFSDIRLNRSLVAGWNTIVLPFDLDGEQVASIFGNDAKVASFSSVSDDVVAFNTTSEGIKAHVPALLKVTAAASGFELGNVTMTAAESALAATGTSWSLVGNYTALKNLEANDYILYNNKFWKNDSYSVKGFHAYLSYTGGNAAAKSFGIVVDGHSTLTTIDGVTVNGKTDEKMYNLSGQRVDGTYKGIVIVNGKKLINQ